MRGPYLYPHLGGLDCVFFRVAGPGLGNQLFPWARCIVDAKRYGLHCIEPSWFNIKPGAWLRRERDKRTYLGLFHNATMSKILMRFIALTTFSKLPENQIETALNNRKNCLIIYRGFSEFFKPIIYDHQLIKNEIVNYTSHTQVPTDLGNKKNKFIAVHVRLGDFTKSSTEGPDGSKDNHRLPLWWYEEKINLLRQHFQGIPIIIFSDGSDEELKNLLKIKNCQRAPKSSAITDILTISQAVAFVASGSTFSMWSSYIGRMPVVWFPGQLRQQLYYDAPECEIESGRGENVPEQFRSAVEQKLSA